MENKNKLKNSLKMGKKKNSQLSLFIIFSIILVIVSVFLISINSYDLFKSEDTQLENQVNELVEKCIGESATTGINLLALQGGFLEINKDVLKDKRRYLDIGIKIPTWDVERNYLPSISLMEFQLNKYIKEKAQNCIQSEFKSLDKFLEYSFEKDIKIDTLILEDYVTINANYPITFNQKNSDTKLYSEEFNVELEKVRLGKIFNLAKKIFEEEVNTKFFEDLIMEQIYGAGDYNSRESLPSEGLHFSCNKKIYRISKLKENLANINNANFKFLQIKNTKDNYLVDVLKNSENNTFYKYYENTYTKDLGLDETYSDFSISVIKPIKNIFKNGTSTINYNYRTFEVTPGNKVITQAEEFKTTDFGIKLPCLQVFSHKYDLDYDLLLTLVDTNENNNRFKFQFPIRVQIKKNKPKVGNLFYFEDDKSQLQSTYCQKENKANPVIIYVKNGKNFLKNAEVEYTCLTYTCESEEKTKKPVFLGFEVSEEPSQIKTNLPYCIGGSLKASKKGYFQTSKNIIDTPYTTLSKNVDEETYEIDMVKIIELPTKKNSFLLIDGIKGIYPSNKVESGEEIYLEIINKKLGFRSQIIYPEKIEGYKNLRLLDLSDTPYDINVYYTKNDSLLGFFQAKDVILNPRNGGNFQVKFPITSKEIGEENYATYMEKIKFGIEVKKYGISIFN